MKINFEKVGIRYRGLIRKIYQTAEEYTNNKYKNAIITISFVGEDRIKELNKLYRKVDRVTDVLSFPMLDINYKQNVKEFSSEISPDGGLYLGDVVICPHKAKQQAKDYNHRKKEKSHFWHYMDFYIFMDMTI